MKRHKIGKPIFMMNNSHYHEKKRCGAYQLHDRTDRSLNIYSMLSVHGYQTG